jgi:hypothetical protein
LREPHGGVSAQPGWTPRRATAATVEPRGVAAESPDAGGSTRDGASADDIGKSWWRREPAAVVERHRVAAVEPRGVAAESPNAGGSARDGASVSGVGGSRREREPVGRLWWSRVGGCRITGCGGIRSGCFGLQLLGD